MIWNNPISQLLKEYDISEQSLTNICEKFHIPNPLSSYKKNVKSGALVSPPPLPDFTHPIFRTIFLYKILYPYIDDEILPDKFKSLIEAESDPTNRIIAGC